MASGWAAYIDLTEEPESPVQQTRPATRSSTQGQEEPGRSGNLGNPAQPAQVIDLTEIDDDDGDVIISGSRALPPRRPWPSFDLLSGGSGDNGSGNGNGDGSGDGSGGGAPGGPLSGARHFLGLGNTFGLQRLSQLTNMALDNIPTLGSIGGGSGSGSSRHPHPYSHAHVARPTIPRRSGRPQRFNRQPSAYNHLRTAPDPLGGNQPDLNYESNGNAAHFDEQLRHHYMIAELARNRQMQQRLDGAHGFIPHEQVDAALFSAQAVFGIPSRPQHFGGGGGGASAAAADPNKPPYVAPPAPPAGFTRDMGEDTVAVCVGCDEELVYDSNQASGDASGGASGSGAGKDGERPTKRRQSRKDREEHPFWGVAGCGHVYCRRCFDNRRNVLKAARPGQPPMEFKTDGRLIFCAAEGCSVDVTAKKAWVGLFV